MKFPPEIVNALLQALNLIIVATGAALAQRIAGRQRQISADVEENTRICKLVLVMAEQERLAKAATGRDHAHHRENDEPASEETKLAGPR